MAPLRPSPKAVTWSGARKGSGSEAAGAGRPDDCCPGRPAAPPTPAAAPKRGDGRPPTAPPGEAGPPPEISLFVTDFVCMEVDIIAADAEDRRRYGTARKASEYRLRDRKRVG